MLLCCAGKKLLLAVLYRGREKQKRICVWEKMLQAINKNVAPCHMLHKVYSGGQQQQPEKVESALGCESEPKCALAVILAPLSPFGFEREGECVVCGRGIGEGVRETQPETGKANTKN